MKADGAGHRESFEIARAPGEPPMDADPSFLRADQASSEADQTASDADQTATDADQSASDADETAAQRDDADALSDQETAAEDQARADEQLPANAGGAALHAYEVTRDKRAATKVHRLATHMGRTRTTGVRGETAADRDATAAARDETARRRDERAQAIDRSIAESDRPLAEKMERVRARAEADRARAAADRARAAADRAEAARERERLEAELHSAHLDDLTGAFRREVGWLALSNEIDRARRGDGRFVIAFVDVDDLKSVNDRDGHAAGDHILRTLVLAMRSHLRSFDPIVRFGGDEFVCGLGGADPDEVDRRFRLIGRSVQGDVGVGFSVGLASLKEGETLDELTARADAALLRTKKLRAAYRSSTASG
jgi:diguanylate cyclase (GGDEF)-like protein